MRFDPSSGKLKVAKDLLHCRTLTVDIMQVLKAVWRFTEFSESRFIGLGSCSRTLIASTLLGLQDLVRFIQSMHGESQWYINGFQRYDASVRALMSIVAFGSFLPESVLSMLMADDRLTEVHGQIQAEIADEMAWIHGLPSELWNFV